MKKLASATILALTLAAGSAIAQTSPTAPAPKPMTPAATTAPVTPSAATAAPAALDAAHEAKFKAADKSGKGFIEGAALDAFKSVMTQVDTDKDGKISRAEYASAVKAGVIK